MNVRGHIDRWWTTAVLVFLSLVLGRGFSAAQAQGHPWGMRMATPARTGQSVYPGAALGTLEWQVPIAGRVNQVAIARDGSIYLGAVFNEEAWSNEVYSYALTGTGEIKYRVKVKPFDWGAGQAIQGSPALDSLGNLILPSTFTQLIKFTPEGEPLWTYQGYSQTIVNSSPAVLAGDSIRHLIAPDGVAAFSPDGAKLFSGSATYSSIVAVGANGDMAVGGVRTSEPHGSIDLWYLNADGSLRWRLTSTFGEEGMPIFGPDGTVFYNRRAFFPDGRLKWTADAIAAGYGANGVLYGIGGGLVALDPATGARIWTTALPGGLNREIAIDLTGNLYATTGNGYLCSVSSAGTINWTNRLCDSLATGPAIGASNNVVTFGHVGFQHVVFSVR